jgi:hypothetical protein
MIVTVIIVDQNEEHTFRQNVVSSDMKEVIDETQKFLANVKYSKTKLFEIPKGGLLK